MQLDFQSDNFSDLTHFMFLQVLTVAFFFLLQTTNTRAEERRQAVFKTKNNSVLFDETPISEIRSDSLMSCSQRCARDKRCKSANFKTDEKTCSLLDKTRNTNPRLFVKQANVIYMEKVPSQNSQKKCQLRTSILAFWRKSWVLICAFSKKSYLF